MSARESEKAKLTEALELNDDLNPAGYKFAVVPQILISCALGSEDLGAKLTHPWTVRVFINSQAAQAFTCQIDAARPSFNPPAPPRASATVTRERPRPRLTKRQR